MNADHNALYLADHCISYIYKLPVNEATAKMDELLSSGLDLDIPFNMQTAIDLMEDFFWHAEIRLIGGMTEYKRKRFDKIGRVWTAWHKVRNPIFCNWAIPKEWFVEHYDNLPLR